MAYLFTEDIKADTLVTFLDHLAKKTCSNMPNKCEKNLPSVNNKQVYETYIAEFACICPSKTCASLPYLCFVWKQERSYVNVRKEPLLTNCGEFERLRESLGFLQRKKGTPHSSCHSGMPILQS